MPVSQKPIETIAGFYWNCIFLTFALSLDEANPRDTLLHPNQQVVFNRMSVPGSTFQILSTPSPVPKTGQANAGLPIPQQRIAPPPMSTIPGHPDDAFERAAQHPLLPLLPSNKDMLEFSVAHPFQTWHLRAALTELPGEPKMARVIMYQQIYQALNHEGRTNLQSLLKRGVLNDNRSDDGHSTLYHLYAILTTPRMTGFKPANLVNETVRILNRPYFITQKFDRLSEAAANQILKVRNNFNQYQNLAGERPLPQPLTWDDINIISSAECVPSSIMYSMADQYPAELTRELSQLTSPMQAFYRKVTLTDLSPDNPEGAYQIFKNHEIHYADAGQNQVWIKVELPSAGLIRAIDSNQHEPMNNVRTGIEAAYQSALTFLATRSYDPANDLRDSEIPGEGSKGLTEMEKTMIETLIKGNGGVASVTYQVVAGKLNPQQDEEGQPFLYGYTRTFEQTAGDIIKALRMGNFVIIGITETEPNGSISGGHEITITSAFVDPQDKQLKFYVIDSDDDVERPVIRSARELIPKIHHAGMPWSLAKEIRSEVESNAGFYYVTDANDMARFDTLAHLNEQLPADAVSPPIISPATEELPSTEENQNAPASSYQSEAETLYDDPTPPIAPQTIHTHWEPINLYQPAATEQLASEIIAPPTSKTAPDLEDNPLSNILSNPALNPSHLTSQQLYEQLAQAQQKAREKQSNPTPV